MQRRGQERRLEQGAASAGLDEGEVVVPADGVERVEAAIEVDEVGASADQHMLAVIDDLSGAGMFVGGGAASDVGAAFEQADLIAAVGEGAGGGESGEASADDGDAVEAGRSLPCSCLRGRVKEDLQEAAGEDAELFEGWGRRFSRSKTFVVVLLDALEQESGRWRSGPRGRGGSRPR